MKALWDRHRRAGFEPPPASLDRTSQLEREERIPSSRFVNAAQCQPRESHPELLVEDPVETVYAERPHQQTTDPALRRQVFKSQRQQGIIPMSQQQPDRLVV